MRRPFFCGASPEGRCFRVRVFRAVGWQTGMSASPPNPIFGPSRWRLAARITGAMRGHPMIERILAGAEPGFER